MKNQFQRLFPPPLLFLHLTLVFFFFLSFSTCAQFWVISGGKADSLSKNFIEEYSIDLSKVDSYKHKIKKDSESYLKQDSLKLEFKKDTIDFDFKNVKLKKLKNKNVFSYLFEADEIEEINMVLDSLVLEIGAELYLLSKDLNDFAGPITRNNFKKGYKRLFHTSAFNSSGIYIILIEPEGSEEIRSHMHLSAVKYKELNSNSKKLKVSSTSPSSDCFPELNPQAFGVGRFESEGRNNCSFAVVNNENNDRRPLVLSARHCISGGDPFTLSSNDIYAIENAEFSIAWRYYCGGSTESTRWVGTGSTYLASQWPSDHLLVELEDDLPFSINYLGWNRVDVSNNTPVYGLHHPSGGVYQSRQHYSSGYITSQGADKYDVNWSIGETTNGSSGSPLFRSGDHVILGGLSYGVNTDHYFKLSNAWSTGNGPLKPHLSNSQNLSSIGALIPTKINGPLILCTNSIATYNMPNLLAGENVTWSVSGGLQILNFTGQSVTLKANGSYISGTLTATYTVISDANQNAVHTLSNSINIWQGKPVISVTNQTTNNTSTGYGMNLSPTGTNSLHFNNTSYVNTVSWSFPSGWSYSSSTGFDVSIYSWSGNSSFTVTATNSCGSNSAYFYPTGGNYRVANTAKLYPNIANEFVNVSLDDGINWDEVDKIRIVNTSTGKVYYSSGIVNSDLNKETSQYKISLLKIPSGSYVVELLYMNRKESHHLIIE